ncbi:hypothetical protein FYK55_11025 [Roseiconus nitratireducens]|uniref:Uncharacterized protein n=1 Tax=Roseiconus nitratireducens TaxID=2605748 RepID=A0A5M6D841_9BACT|nr:SxtJ family membrane protein [Roseiconus nitratireducens]KAA5543718.1 hypothetical protein FYK55_11025 [Roseiconus nitratireducens]
MIHSPPLTDQQLRYFGGSLALMLVMFAALAQWRFGADGIATALLVLAVALTLVYYAVPKSRRPIYNGFRALTFPIQWLVLTVILSLIFYVVLTPIGLLLRWSGRDIRRQQPDQASVWSEHRKKQALSRYFETF